MAASCPGYILPDNNNTAFKGSHDSYTTRTRYSTRLKHDTTPTHGRFQNLRQSDSWRSNDITTSRLHSLRYCTITVNPRAPPRNLSDMLSVVWPKPKNQLSMGSRYSQVSSSAKSVGMCWENIKISSDSLTSGRSGNFLIAFSNVMRMLTTCVTGGTDAVPDAGLLERVAEAFDSIAYAIT